MENKENINEENKNSVENAAENNFENSTEEKVQQDQQEPEANQDTEKEAEAQPEGEPEPEPTEEEKLQQKLDEQTRQTAAMQDKYLRLMAEFDNFRKRTNVEKADLIKSAGAKVITNILPVLDDFERALKNMEKAEDVKSILTGVELIYQKFLTTLQKEGLHPINTEDADFNVDFHEAIALVPAPTPELKGKVLDCVQTGYTLNEKVIRHAKVAVGQ